MNSLNNYLNQRFKLSQSENILEKLKISETSFMLEKLKISSKSKVNNNFDPDNMNNEKICIYSGNINNIHKTLENIGNDRDIYAFLLSRKKSLTECIESGISKDIAYHFDLDMILDEVLDYLNNTTIMIYIENGRIHIQQNNNNFFIYGLSESGYNKCEEYFDQLDFNKRKSNQDLSFFKKYNLFIEIKYEKNK